MFSATLTACGDDDGFLPTEEQNDDDGTNNTGGDSNSPTDSIANNENTGNTTSGNKTLVVYFSRAGENWQVGNVERGNTAIMGDYIQELTGADVFEIVPEVAYPVDYYETIAIANQERDSNARPAIKSKLENLSEYGTVFIGSGIWGGEPPMIMHTFYEAYPELAGKTLIPFGTHGGSGISSITSLLRQYFPNTTILEGLGISGASIRNDSSKETVRNWLQRIGVEINENNSGMTKDEAGVTAWIEQWAKAMVAQDVETLSSMMADDIVIRHITGATQTKQEWLDEVGEGSMRYYDIQHEDINITINGDYATATYVMVINANIWGSTGTWRINTTRYLQWNGSTWIRINNPNS